MTEPEHSKLSDEELVARTLLNRNAYSALIHRFERPLLRYIKRITNVDDMGAEDILQEVFIKAYVNLRGFDPAQKFSSWIYRIARNEAISQFRKRDRRPEGHAHELGDEVINRIRDDMDLPKEADRAFLQESVAEALSKLDKKYRDVLVLKYFEEKDYSEISDILQKPEGTIATLLHRAKKQFRESVNPLSIQENI